MADGRGGRFSWLATLIAGVTSGLQGCRECEFCAAPQANCEDSAGAGPFAVGYRESALSYSDPDPEAPPGTQRELRLATWYPSDDESGVEPRYLGLFDAPGVWENAGLADPVPEGFGPFHLAVFSHGHQGFAENSSFIASHLASHGWLVAAPDHRGNTFLDGSERETPVYFQRPRDVLAVLEHLASLPAWDALAGAVDAAAPALVMGHSFGAYTAMALAGAEYDEAVIDGCGGEGGVQPFCSTMTEARAAVFREELPQRFAAAIAMAPGDFGLFGAEGVASVDTPSLVMTGALDPSTASGGDAYWEALRDGSASDSMRLDIAGAGHQAFTDFAESLGETVDEGYIEPERAKRVVRTYVLEKARESGIDACEPHYLDDPAAPFPEATVSTR